MSRQERTSEITLFLPIVKMLAASLGQDAVVLLYRFLDGNPEIVCAFRDSEPCTTEPMEAYFLQEPFRGDYLSNVAVRSADGCTYRSSVAAIRDGGGQRVGAIALRFDTSRMSDAVEYLQSFLRFEMMDSRPTHPQSVEEMVDGIIGDILKEAPQPDGSKRSDKMELVSRLEKKGIFLTRGAVEKVSERMGIAPVTVYSYLDEIRKRRKAKEKEQSEKKKG